jgi:hypothetical protein
MKNIVIFFDIVLLVLVLGIMLPFLLGGIKPLTSMESWGFSGNDDKTMKLYEGDVLSQTIHNDSLPAAEIMLMAESAGNYGLKYNGLILPGGQTVVFDNEFVGNRALYLNIIRNSLNNTRRYMLVFDDGIKLWRVTPIT